LILAQKDKNRDGKLAYKCSRCEHFIYLRTDCREKKLRCCACYTYFTEVVKDKTTYLAMYEESPSEKNRLKNCVCSGCRGRDVYSIAMTHFRLHRCICTNCGISGLCLPSKNPATNAQFVGWNELKQRTKGKPLSELVLAELCNSI
jgi:hypothetical protein